MLTSTEGHHRDRLLSQSYDDNTTPAAYFAHDETSIWGVNPSNPKGSMTHEIVSFGSTCTADVFSYDAMGRVAQVSLGIRKSGCPSQRGFRWLGVSPLGNHPSQSVRESGVHGPHQGQSSKVVC